MLNELKNVLVQRESILAVLQQAIFAGRASLVGN